MIGFAIDSVGDGLVGEGGRAMRPGISEMDSREADR